MSKESLGPKDLAKQYGSLKGLTPKQIEDAIVFSAHERAAAEGRKVGVSDYRHITKELDLAAKESVTDFRAIIEEKNEDLELQKIFGREKYSIFAKIQRTILYALASSLIEARTYEGFDPNFVLDETKKYLSLFLENEEINETFDDELQLQVVKMTFARKIESLVKAITDFDIEVNAGL